MRRLTVIVVVWCGFLAGLLAVAIANRPAGHEAGPVPKGYLGKLVGQQPAFHPGPLEAWSSTYTLAFVLGTIALAVTTCIVLVYGDRHSAE